MATTATVRILDTDFTPRLAANSLYMLRFRYLRRQEDGTFEEPVEMFRRVAWNLASAERLFQPAIGDDTVLDMADRFFSLMTDFRFLPNAPTLLAAGTRLQQLSACNVLPVGDSVSDIFEAVRMAAVCHSKGCGTGFSFSHVRPRGAPIATGGCATGPVSFLRVFDAATEAIKRGGTGWGANMGVLRCDHPDVAEFITAKSHGQLQNFNLSVGVSDAFLGAVDRGEPWPLVDPTNGQTTSRVDARELFNLMTHEAWKTGDPGLLFLDRIERDNPTPALGRIEATNPCGEAPLLPYESCWLGGVNVAAHLDASGSVDWSMLDETCETALRMMDNAIEVSDYPLPQIREATFRTRKVGIGVMGFADLLIRLNTPYGSAPARDLASRIMARIRSTLTATSEALGRERGPFPAFSSGLAAPGMVARRNATVTANAPNSTIAAIAGCSSGVEPIFSIASTKRLANGDRLSEVHPLFVEVSRHRGFADRATLDEIVRTGSCQGIQAIPAEVAHVFVTAHDIDVGDHIRIQAAFQEHTELAVAKTVNLPNHATPEDVRRAFLVAHSCGCKGITCFRNGCRESAFLHVGTTAAVSASTACGDYC